MQHTASIALHDARLEEPDVRQLYDEHAVGLRMLAGRLLGPNGDVDDLVHDAFLVACRRCASVSRKTALAFLLQTTIKLAAGKRRRARFRRLFGFEKEAPSADWLTPERVAEQRDAHRIVHEILERLPDKRRTVFILHELQGMTGEEIAAVLGCPVDTVWSRFYKARREFVAAVRELHRRGLLPNEEGLL